jgi:LytS/YehU family sensor histidine kinase
VSLRQELASLEDYLDIQRVRFGDRLSVNLTVDPRVLDARVPVFLLQPLMENAIEHGGADDGRVTIELSASRMDDMLHVALADDGGGTASRSGRGHTGRGIGLGNTRARLEQLYGDRASVELRSENRTGAETGGTNGMRVEVRLPFVPVPT